MSITRLSDKLPPVALIAGPTASGKSSLALALAERAGGTIVNADASQVYRDLRLLSARPSPDEEARVPHLLFGHVDGAMAMSAAAWAKEATAVIDDLHAKGRLPVLVGGTGLYIRTLIEGIAPVPEIPAEIRTRVRSLRVGDAHVLLQKSDPEMAERLHPTDTTRVARALEVVEATGRSILEWRQDRKGGLGHRIALNPLLLLPPREELYARCDQRFDAMIAGGALEEARQLASRALDPSLPVMRAIGVPDLLSFLSGQTDFQTAITDAKQATRNYAKRQYTWFRNQPPKDWPRAIDAVNGLNLLTES